MDKKQLDSLLSLVKRLQYQKYPTIVIAIIAILALFFNGLPKATDDCEVLNIYDGDTMTLQCQGEETKVRLYCIDAPEMGQTPWGKQARDHLRSIAGNAVKLVRLDKDRYGRVVGEVYRGDENLNLAQVKTGYAAVYDAYCKKSEYPLEEQRANSAKQGIWSTPGIHQTPWEWRKQK
jgi:endonuclease YncB( thermonuclease family)